MTTYLSPVAGSADNTSIINAAIQLVTSGNAASVILEEGLFVVDNIIHIDRPISFHGSGDGVTTLAFGENGGIVIALEGALSSVSLGNFDVIAKDRIKRSVTAIQTTNLNNSKVSGITIRDHLTGIELNNATVVTVENISMLEMTNQATGILVNGGRDHYLNNIHIDQATPSSDNEGGSVGIDVPFCTSTCISNVNIINFDYGVRFHPCRAGQPTHQAVEWCSLSQVAVRHCKIAGFYFNASTAAGNNTLARIMGVSLVNCSAGSNQIGVVIEKSDTRAKIDGIDLIGIRIIENLEEGIRIGSSYSLNTSDERIRNIKIADCKIAANSDSGCGLKSGVCVGNGTQNIQIVDCSIGTWGQSVATQSHAINLENSPIDGTTGIIITGNMLEGAVGAAISDQVQTRSKVIKANSGYVTEFSGQAFVANGLVEVTVNHFCDGIPVWVSITPMDNMHNYDPPVITSITATTFKIVLSAAAFGNKFFLFRAQVYS